MTLWGPEVEALRPAIRAEADGFVAAADYGSKSNDGRPASMDLAARRALMVSVEVHSDCAIDRMIPGPDGDLRIRTFATEGPARAVLLHFHGGGWSIGRPEMSDRANESLATKLGIAVVSVDYRLAPEYRFPSAADDCEAAAAWLVAHSEAEFGTSKLLIGGESSGAHLAVVTLLRMRDRHDSAARFVGANLQYGFYDLGHLPSHSGVNGGPDIIDAAGLAAMADLVLPGMSPEQRRAPQHSPLWADLRDLPPALFAVGLDDHLSDDTVLLASRWERAGNQSELLAYPDAPHGCTGVLPSVIGHFTPLLEAFLNRCVADEKS